MAIKVAKNKDFPGSAQVTLTDLKVNLPDENRFAALGIRLELFPGRRGLLDAGLGEQLEPIQLAFQYATVEPLVRLLCPAGASEPEGGSARSTSFKWNPQFDDVPVNAVAEWQGLRLSAGAITRLEIGDVLMLDPHCAAQVQLRLSRIPKFFGRPGTRAGKWAVELTGHVSA